MSDKRTCAYCGNERNIHGRDKCDKCTYRPKRKRADGRNAGIVVTCENTSAETTLQEFIDSIKESLPHSITSAESCIGTWKWSFSQGRFPRPAPPEAPQ